jgi:hypothetical protein
MPAIVLAPPASATSPLAVMSAPDVTAALASTDGVFRVTDDEASTTKAGVVILTWLLALI